MLNKNGEVMMAFDSNYLIAPQIWKIVLANREESSKGRDLLRFYSLLNKLLLLLLRANTTSLIILRIIRRVNRSKAQCVQGSRIIQGKFT
jgi:hypothetical protein